jgi:predicted ATPase/DNA-binding SARP family transcriptional activator
MVTIPVPESTDHILEIRLFGKAEVRVRGLPLPPLHSRRGLWILALLALRGGRPIERLRLAGLLWPDSPDSTALHNLRQALADVRRALGPAAQCVRAGSRSILSLEVSSTRIDVLDFEAAVAEGTGTALERAAQLYRGPLLEGCDEPWALEARTASEQTWMSVVERLAAASVDAGDHGGAARWLRLGAAADPYRESIHRALMKSLAAAGELTSATEVYRELRQRLYRDLNGQPDSETTAVFRALRTRTPAETPVQASPAKRRPYRRIPGLRTPLVGRDDAARNVAVLLERNRLVTLFGAGGIGKTSLAVRIAGELEEEYDHGVVFVPLASLADPGMVPDAVREAADLKAAEGITGTTALLADHFSARCALLVLDNCEHLLAACAELADTLLTQCPDVRILATSRHALGIGGETVWRVPSLALPPTQNDLVRGTQDLTAIEASAAVKLFVTRARAVQSSFRLTAATAPAVVDICRRLDGIPLAIDLAAARVRSLPVGEISRRLAEDMKLLAGGGPPTVARHHTLEAAFRWSWDLLTARERTVLSRLSAFAGGCTLVAAEEVCSGDEIARPDVVDLLTALVDKSLVVFDAGSYDPDEHAESATDMRYRLLEPVRQFSAARLRDSGHEDGVRLRHRDYFLSLAEEAGPKLTGAESTTWIGRLDMEHDNLRASLAASRENRDGDEEGIRLAIALWRFWEVRGYLSEGREHLACVLSRDGGQEWTKLRADALNGAGNLAWSQGDYAVARSLHEECLAIRRKLGDSHGVAPSLSNLGNVACCEGDYAKARELFTESLSIRRELGDRRAIAASLNDLGTVAYNQGDYDKARSLYVEGLAIFREIGDRAYVANLLTNLGSLSTQHGDYAAARACLSEGVRHVRDLGNKLLACYALEACASLAAAENGQARAGRLWGAAEALREAIGAPLPAPALTELDSTIADAREASGEGAFAAAWAEGRAMTMEQALDYALAATTDKTADVTLATAARRP